MAVSQPDRVGFPIEEKTGLCMRAGSAGGRDTWLSGFKSHRLVFCGWADYGSDGLSDLADPGDSDDLGDLADPGGLSGPDDSGGLRGLDDPGGLRGLDDPGDLSDLDNPGGSSDLDDDSGGWSKQDDSGCSGVLDWNDGFGGFGYHGDSGCRQCVTDWHQLQWFRGESGNSLSALSPPPPEPSALLG